MSGDSVGDSLLVNELSMDLFLSDFDLVSDGKVELSLSSDNLIGREIFFLTLFLLRLSLELRLESLEGCLDGLSTTVVKAQAPACGIGGSV